jgi:hypothetical protein
MSSTPKDRFGCPFLRRYVSGPTRFLSQSSTRRLGNCSTREVLRLPGGPRIRIFSGVIDGVVGDEVRILEKGLEEVEFVVYNVDFSVEEFDLFLLELD